jgi:hypothetical protein
MMLRGLGIALFTLFVGSAAAQVTTGYVYAGPAFGGHLDGAGRFGVGLDFRIASQFDLGGELGTIFKDSNVGILASGNVTYHFTHARRREAWDPFLVGGISGAHLAGAGGAYLNLGAGVNYWVGRRWAIRAEFKGYPGGGDLGGFAEFRFGITFRP